MKSWREEFSATWLDDPDFVARYDEWSRTRAVHHRPDAQAESALPWTVDLLVADIKRFGADGRWLWCTSAIALLAELIFGIDAGGVFASDGRHRFDLAQNVTALRELRNACFHPAFQNAGAGSGTPPIENIIEILDNDDDGAVREAAVRFAVDWSYLAGRPVTSFALRQMDSAGRLYADAIGLP